MISPSRVRKTTTLVLAGAVFIIFVVVLVSFLVGEDPHIYQNIAWSPGVGSQKHDPAVPKPEKLVQPEYPDEALRANIEGTVTVKVHVGKDGSVIEALLYEDSGTDVGFEEAALEAARNGEWLPSVNDSGQPVSAWVVYPIAFKIGP